MKHKNHKIIKTALAIIILTVFAYGGWAIYRQHRFYLAEASKIQQIPAEGIIANVTRVVDGDTIKVDIDGFEDTVRLIGINAPEIARREASAQCFADMARSRMNELVDGEAVGLVPDKSQSPRDKYGRLLAYVYLNDGMLVNQEMISEGFAFEHRYAAPYKYEQKFRAAEIVARGKQKGVWNRKGCAYIEAPKIEEAAEESVFKIF